MPGTESTILFGEGEPSAVAADGNGNVYIVDYTSNQVLKETLSGGSYTQSVVPTSSLNRSLGVAVDGAGNVYIADSRNQRVLKETLSAGSYSESVVVDFSGDGGTEPISAAVDGTGNVFFCDGAGGNVYLDTLTASSYIQRIIVGGLSDPADVAVDGNGNIYISDIDEILKASPTSQPGVYGATPIATISGAIPETGIALDGSGNVYVLMYAENLQGGQVCKETATASGYTQSTIATSTLYEPGGIAVDGGGNLYIADTGNSRVLKENLADPPTLTFATTAPAQPAQTARRRWRFPTWAARC